MFKLKIQRDFTSSIYTNIYFSSKLVSVLRAMAERVERITCREDFWMEILHGKRERRSFFCPRELADRVLSRGKQLIRSFRRRLIHSTLLSSLLWPPASILHHQAEKGDGTREEEERRLSDVRKQSVGEAEFREWTSSQRETVDGRSFILPPFVHVASASSSRTLFITFPFVLWIFFSRACLRFDSPPPLFTHPTVKSLDEGISADISQVSSDRHPSIRHFHYPPRLIIITVASKLATCFFSIIPKVKVMRNRFEKEYKIYKKRE